MKKKFTKKYLVKWQRYHDKEAAWVVAKNMVNAKELVVQFEETRPRGSNKMKRRH